MNQTAKKGDKVKYTGLTPYKSISAHSVLFPGKIYEVEDTREDYTGKTYTYLIKGKRLWVSALGLFKLQTNNDL